MSEGMKQQMINIADKFCEVYGVTRQDLFQKHNYKGGKKKKVVNKVNVSNLRMALGYYLANYYPISLTEVAKLIGYNDHSTISYNNQKIYFYIKNNDEKFMKYWFVLNEIGKVYNHIKFSRINKNQLALEN
jgi:chromosomal replication initiation ATPase DnaA